MMDQDHTHDDVYTHRLEGMVSIRSPLISLSVRGSLPLKNHHFGWIYPSC
jgi:hypothetical protein